MDCESSLFYDAMRLPKVVSFSYSLLKRYNASKGNFFCVPLCKYPYSCSLQKSKYLIKKCVLL